MLSRIRVTWPALDLHVALLLLVIFSLAGCGAAQPLPSAPAPWSSSLPHSMKGYELYSWRPAGEEAWRYVLVTGTNRLKGYDEIISAENGVTEGGLVAISVVGFDDLEALLSQLPRGEEVTWIGERWLRQVGADPELVETMRLPDETTISQIVRSCQERGVTLHVTGATD